MPGSAAPRRILIAQPEPQVRAFLVDAIRHLGYEPRTVATGREAMSELLRERYSLVIAEIDLPGATGLQLAREIRERGFLLPLLILAYSEDTLLLESTSLEIGGVHSLVKPFDLSDLGKAVAQVLSLAEDEGRDPEATGRG